MTLALKEWAVGVDALCAGRTIMLLRKGGIREPRKSFQIERQQALLYPTYEHQKPHLLSDEYAEQVTSVPDGWHPHEVKMSGWARITHCFTVGETRLAALAPFHIWNDRFVEERLAWKPERPLYLLLLRVYRLPQVQAIAYRRSYGGCRSWIELEEAIELTGSTAVLDESDYRDRVAAIETILASN